MPERKYKALVDKSPDIMYVLDPKGRFCFVGGAVHNLLGFTAEELKREHFTSIIWPEDVKKVKWRFNDRRTVKRSTEGFEVRLTTREGKSRYVDIKYLPVEIHAFGFYDKPVSAKGKKFLGTYGVARDITDRKRAEEALKQSEKRYRLLADNVSDVIWTLDMNMNHTCVSPSVERLRGYSVEEAMNQNIEDILTPSSLEVALKTLREELALGNKEPKDLNRSRKLELEMKCKDGSTVWTEVRVSFLRDKQDKPVEILGVTRDITERRRAEQALKQFARRLEEKVEQRTKELKKAHEQLVCQEKLAVLGKLAGGVGHELLNPLGAVKNAAYFLNMAIEEPEPEVKEALEILEREVGTSERVISSLLDFARPKAPRRIEVDVNDIVQAALSGVPVPENVDVVTQLDETLPIIPADPDQLYQVFENIIANAIQAMPEGGQLIVRSQVEQEKWVTVYLGDTGVGIADKHIKKVFEPLFTTKAKGMGLGLALSRLLVDAHGGSIQVRGELGKGSTFTVNLPMSESSGKEK